MYRHRYSCEINLTITRRLCTENWERFMSYGCISRYDIASWLFIINLSFFRNSLLTFSSGRRWKQYYQEQDACELRSFRLLLDWRVFHIKCFRMYEKMDLKCSHLLVNLSEWDWRWKRWSNLIPIRSNIIKCIYRILKVQMLPLRWCESHSLMTISFKFLKLKS